MTSAAKIPELTAEAVHRRHYALWARNYDESPNPLLSLEERYLTPLLPELSNADVLDVGCGTGRWLSRLANSATRSLTGIDLSPEMLDCAKGKLGQRASFAVGSATSLPIATQSSDVVLASFVTSYVHDLGDFIAELRRVVRDEGSIYLADVHPETELSCHWKRGFRTDGERVRLATCSRSLSSITAYARSGGLRVTTLLEPTFGLPELEIFQNAGKLDSFHASEELPAIYILELRPSKRGFVGVTDKTAPTLLQRARIALDACTAIVSDIEISGSRIEAIRSGALEDSEAKRAETSDLRGYLLLPGLINAHDHLEFGLYPNLGHPPYGNFVEWAADIHERDKDLIAANKSIPRDVQLWWGAIRNLLCGVTTVCHHNPIYPELIGDEFPLKVVKECEWAHSLALDHDLPEKFGSSSAPFVIHAAEGVDERAQRDIYALDDIGALNERTVVVHGVGLNAHGVQLLNKRSAALIWCPSSNQFLFGRTHTREAIADVDRVMLGSDSPLTAAGDLLDEVCLAHEQVGISPDDLYRFVLENPKDILHLKSGEGRIRAGGPADFIAVRDAGLNPAQALTSISFADIELVVVSGRVQVASDQLFRRLPQALTEGMSPLQVESVLRWVRAPLGRLFREAERALGCDLRIGGKRVRHVCSAWL